jgi:phospholipase D1/2
MKRRGFFSFLFRSLSFLSSKRFVENFNDSYLCHLIFGLIVRNFFANTKVIVKPLLRSGHMGIEELIFSHHQKTIICDSSDGTIAYLGGLDLTRGRWDSPHHLLFSTLQTDHKDDFYQAGIPTATSATGPRQPWHDIHVRVEGEIALDVFENFRQRWYKNVENPNFNVEHLSKMIFGGKSAENKARPIVEIKDVKNFPVSNGGNWTCQLLRSIDKFSIDSNGEGEASINRSIHNAYVMRIATAQRFVYIENQYFMGSSHYWKDVVINPDLRNLIPLVITEKIISKIEAKEPFIAYIIVPLHPEGDPASMGMQAMLRWQYNTLRMMYKRIAEAIHQVGGSQLPSDYLVFMCLCNRESPVSGIVYDKMTHGAIVNRRHMVYVHSKMMIVDDEYAIIGSANVNDRSMRGNRDTEIAVLCHSANPEDVKRFRLSLWFEHFGRMEEAFTSPEAFECGEVVRSIASRNWDIYAASGMTFMSGHACLYPYIVSSTGEVSPWGDGKFPDFPLAEIAGKVSPLPNDVTT